jgi:predicted ATPase/tetratricopeptide (TPR) repeat protein
VEARRGPQVLTRWPSRPAALLLARLALAPQRAHPREEMVELLWPGVPLEVGRNRLRQTLSTLKSLLEAGPGAGPVIEADRQNLRLVPGALHSDAVQFERLVRAGDWAAARPLYGGELLPGHYDDWVLESRTHLAALFERVDARTVPEPAAAPLPAPDPLPASWTRVFGIEHRATRLLAMVRHERLVTVVGPGGCGKTRLTLEAARALRDGPAWSVPPDAEHKPAPRFARIVFVPLADCSDEAQAVAALARALHLTGADPLQQARQALAGAPVLLVLDNFEQLVATARPLPMQLLEALPALHLVLTSRQRLDVPGEQVFTLGGLPLPDADTPPAAGAEGTPEARLRSARLNPAVALFVDRARAVRPDFQLDAKELGPVCALVRALDGLPLALELAASRVGSYAPAQLLQMLLADGSLRLLARTTPRAGHDRRQASMEQVIDWSWRLLSGPEQAAMAALSAFAGDAGLPGLAAVLGEPAAAVAARLDDLAGHSLLRTVAPAAQAVEPRFLLMEPVREFVRQRWPAPALAGLQQAIHHWLLHWAQGLGPAQQVSAVETELRTVLWALQQQPAGPAAAVALALSTRTYWEAAGMPASPQAALERALQALAGDEARRAAVGQTHELLAFLRFEAGFIAEARHHADTALALAPAGSAQHARALVRRVWVDLATGHGMADPGPQTERLEAMLDEALTVGRAVGDADAQARALHQLAVMRSSVHRDWAGAEAMLAESEALWLSVGDHRKANARLRNRAQCWVHLGRADEARACFEHCERAALEQGNWVEQIDSLISLSSLLISQRQWQAALDLTGQCVQLCWQRWHRHGLGYALWNAPLALAHLRRPGQAAQLMGFAMRFWESNFGPLGPSDRDTVRRVRRLAQAQLGRSAAEAAWQQGQAMSVNQAVALVAPR